MITKDLRNRIGIYQGTLMPVFKRAKRRNRARSPRCSYHLLCHTPCGESSLLAYSLERVRMGIERDSRAKILEGLEMGHATNGH